MDGSETSGSKIWRRLAWAYMGIVGFAGIAGIATGDVATGSLCVASAVFAWPGLKGLFEHFDKPPPPVWVQIVCAFSLFVAAGATVPEEKPTSPALPKPALKAPVAAPEPEPKLRTAHRRDTKAITREFTQCLLAKGKVGNYSSFDGGTSSVLLMGECRSAMNAYIDDCMTDGKTDPTCTTQAAILSQGALKLLDK